MTKEQSKTQANKQMKKSTKVLIIITWHHQQQKQEANKRQQTATNKQTYKTEEDDKVKVMGMTRELNTLSLTKNEGKKVSCKLGA